MDEFYSFFRIFGYRPADDLVRLVLLGCFLYVLYFDNDFSLLAKRVLLIGSIILMYLIVWIKIPFLRSGYLPGIHILSFDLLVIMFLVLVLFQKTRSFFREHKMIKLASLAAYVAIGIISLLPIYNQHWGMATFHGHGLFDDHSWYLE